MYAHKCVHLWRSVLLSAIYCTSYLYLRLLLRQRRLCNASTVACLLVLWWRVVVKVVSILHWVISALGLGGHVLSLVVFLLHLVVLWRLEMRQMVQLPNRPCSMAPALDS